MEILNLMVMISLTFLNNIMIIIKKTMEKIEDQLKRNLPEYTFGKLIAKGSYGKVYNIENNLTREKLACKLIKTTGNSIHNAMNEILAWRSLSHPNIIKIFDVFRYASNNSNYLVIVMEKCDDTLTNLISSKKLYDISTRLQILWQLIDALIYMNQQGFVHTDLSLNNIMLKENEVRIIDFGFMHKKGFEPFSYHNITQNVQPPELYNGNPTYTHMDKIDIWSLGIIYHTMCYKCPLIRWDSDMNYLLDLISYSRTIHPSILERYGLMRKYIDYYYRIFDPEKKEVIQPIKKKLLKVINELRLYNNKNKNYCNYLLKRTPENKFIKKLLNFNSNTRPDIFQVRYLYNKYFQNIAPKLSDNMYQSYSTTHISYAYVDYLDLINIAKPVYSYPWFINIHYQYSSFNDTYADILVIIKTILAINLIWSGHINSHVELLDTYINAIPNMNIDDKHQALCDKYSQIYSFISSVYKNDENINRFNNKRKIINNPDSFIHTTLELMDYMINIGDPILRFFESNVPPEHYNKFLYMIYIMSGSYGFINFDDADICSAILLIIISYKNKDMRDKLIREYVLLDLILYNEINVNDITADPQEFNTNASPMALIIVHYIINCITIFDKKIHYNIASKFKLQKKFVDYIYDFNR